MIISLSKNELKEYVKTQLEYFFPDKYKFAGNDVDAALDLALDRTENCFKHIAMPLFWKNNNCYFSHLNGDQYSQFLYFLSNSLWDISENKAICDKIMQLNRMLTGCFWSYKSGLPDIFLLAHAVGTVIGKAPYGDYLFIGQDCTIATQRQLEQSKWGKGLYLGAGAMILNVDTTIGDNCAIGAGTKLYTENNIPDNTKIYSKEGKNIFEKNDFIELNKKLNIWIL